MTTILVIHLSRVEGLLDQGDEVLLAGRLLLPRRRRLGLVVWRVGYRDCPSDVAGRGTLLQSFEPVGRGFRGEVRARARDLDQRELERQPRVAALAHVVDRDGEQVTEP